MCGLAAFVAVPGARISPDLAPQFDRDLRHRGPDASGIGNYARDGTAVAADKAEVVLVHRRLAIIDLDHRSEQPMSTADGRYSIIFNGEIYNYIELRDELARLGHGFRTRSDTEVLLAAFAQWGAAALARLAGMFALVIFDRKRSELFLARDPFGIKPLYWARGGDGIAFASEIGPLLRFAGVGRRANNSRVFQYLATGQTDAGEETLFAGVRSLPAGCCATISVHRPAAPDPQRYWTLQIAPVEQPIDRSIEKLREAFIESVRLHLRSDVPVGITLSGGIDSSAILACTRLLGGDKLGIRTYSFAATGSDVDETEFITCAATAAGAGNELVRIAPEDIEADIDRLIAVQGEPFGSLSIYAQYRVMQRAARDGIKVMLSGQGGDELLAGYRPYLARRLSDLLFRGQIGSAIRLARSMASLPGGGAPLFAQAFEPAVPRKFRAALRRLTGRPILPSWIREGWFASRHGTMPAPDLHFQEHFLHHAMRQSTETTVLPALLRYEDRNSMAFSIESRVPFLTPALARLAYSLPADHLISSSGTTKSAFRAAMRGLVPDAILDRRDKIGFATPDQLWSLRLQTWFKRVLQSDMASALPWLDAKTACNVLDRRSARSGSFGTDVWRTINLIRWAEKFNVEFG